jgi:hypothetical protein
MTNLFIQFIKESTAKQENIAFINSIRKNSNLKPYSLISEAPAPAPQIAPGPGGSEFDRFNRYMDDTFGRGVNLDSDIRHIPIDPVDPVQQSWMMFDNLLRDLFGQQYSSLPTSFIMYLYGQWGGNPEGLANFINTIGTVSYTTQNGTQISGTVVFNKFILDLAALSWISNNLTDLNNLSSSPQLQQLLYNNPEFHAHIMGLIQTIQGKGGLNTIFNYATIYSNIFNSFMSQGIVFPPNMADLFGSWAQYFTDITFTLTNPALSQTVGVVNPQNLPNPTAISQILTNNLSAFNNSNFSNLIQLIQSSYNASMNGSLMNMMQLQSAANQLGITPEQLSQLLVYTNGLSQQEFNAMIQSLLQAQQSGNNTQIIQTLMNAALNNPSNAQTYNILLDFIRRILRL